MAKLTGVAALFAGVDEGNPGKLGVRDGARRWGESVLLALATDDEEEELVVVAVAEEAELVTTLFDVTVVELVVVEATVGTFGTGIVDIELT